MFEYLFNPITEEHIVSNPEHINAIISQIVRSKEFDQVKVSILEDLLPVVNTKKAHFFPLKDIPKTITHHQNDSSRLSSVSVSFFLLCKINWAVDL